MVLENKVRTLRLSIYKTEAYWLVRSHEVLGEWRKLHNEELNNL
jgi:hypothetical protein